MFFAPRQLFTAPAAWGFDREKKFDIGCETVNCEVTVQIFLAMQGVNKEINAARDANEQNEKRKKMFQTMQALLNSIDWRGRDLAVFQFLSLLIPSQQKWEICVRCHKGACRHMLDAMVCTASAGVQDEV